MSQKFCNILVVRVTFWDSDNYGRYLPTSSAIYTSGLSSQQPIFVVVEFKILSIIFWEDGGGMNYSRMSQKFCNILVVSDV